MIEEKKEKRGEQSEEQVNIRGDSFSLSDLLVLVRGFSNCMYRLCMGVLETSNTGL